MFFITLITWTDRHFKDHCFFHNVKRLRIFLTLNLFHGYLVINSLNRLPTKFWVIKRLNCQQFYHFTFQTETAKVITALQVDGVKSKLFTFKHPMSANDWMNSSEFFEDVETVVNVQNYLQLDIVLTDQKLFRLLLVNVILWLHLLSLTSQNDHWRTFQNLKPFNEK